MQHRRYIQRRHPDAEKNIRTSVSIRQAAAFAILLGCILSLAWLAYRPGLAGSFLFDDFANLPALGSFGPIDNVSAFERYITSGFADPTGRPLALLSFLIDANDWPADPAPFKYTNVLLHLLNGALLCWLLLFLGCRLGKSEKSAALAALAGTGIWLLHPLWISTTLYVVQREAMLPATFTLAGLLGYLHGRSRIDTNPVCGTIWIASSLIGCTLLSAFSKASGLLLPLLVLVIEYAFLRSLPVDPTTTKSAKNLSRCRRRPAFCFCGRLSCL